MSVELFCLPPSFLREHAEFVGNFASSSPRTHVILVQGYLEDSTSGSGYSGAACATGAGEVANYKLSALGPALSNSITTANSSLRQRPAPRQSSQPLLLSGATSCALQFAYAPLQNIRGGATLETGLRGQGSKSSTSSSVGTAGETTSTRNASPRRAAAAGRGVSGVGATAAGEGSSSGSGSSPGDVGSWNASMQALCAMLRARRCDVVLTGLIFLGLEACVREWAQACDAGSEQVGARSGGGGWRPSYLGTATTAAAVAGASAGAPSPSMSVKGNTASSPVSLATQDSVARLSPRVNDIGLNSVSKNERSPPRARRSVVQGRTAGAGPRQKEHIAAAAARGKMQLGTREALKAGLVWAEAVPLGRSTVSTEGGDRRGAGPGGSASGGVGGSGGVGNGDTAGSASLQASQTTAPECITTETPFNAPLAEAVVRLCRYLMSDSLDPNRMVPRGRGGDAEAVSTLLDYARPSSLAMNEAGTPRIIGERSKRGIGRLILPYILLELACEAHVMLDSSQCKSK